MALEERCPHAVVISTINLKGGVGKTTTTVAVAEMLSGEFGKRVLLVDLDPQTNATSMLIGDERWGELNSEDRTLAKLFSDALLEPEERSFDLQSTLVRKASRVAAVRSLSLLPSSLDMIDTQDKLGSMSSGRFYAESPTDILRRAVTPILGEFDIVLIDCPPNLGIITLNGLRMSQLTSSHHSGHPFDVRDPADRRASSQLLRDDCSNHRTPRDPRCQIPDTVDGPPYSVAHPAGARRRTPLRDPDSQRETHSPMPLARNPFRPCARSGALKGSRPTAH